MSPVSAKDVKELREQTGLGMMDCKTALEETKGNFEEAVDYLRKKGIAKGAARAERSTGEGLINSYIHPGGRVGVLIEVGCETDFVARSDDFQSLVHDLAMQIAAAKPQYVNREEVPEEKIRHEIEIYQGQMIDENKPPEIMERIAKGKLEKFFKESCLLEQEFIKNSEQTIGDLILKIGRAHV